MGGKKKLSLLTVVKMFEDRNCKYLDDFYVNNQYPHNYQCSCGNISKIAIGNFQQGQTCYKCRNQKLADKFKYKIDRVREIFKEKKCVYLDDTYKNNRTLQNYICECGNKHKITLDSFLKGHRCPACKGGIKHTIEYVKKYFKERNCEFLDDVYISNDTPHNYICVCGNKSKIRFDNFQSGRKCSNCSNTGFKNSDPAYLYLISRPNQFKIGIYNAGTKRLNEHKKYGWQLIEQKYFEKGIEAYEEEQKLLKLLDNNKIPRGKQAFKENFERGGYTEAWNDVDLTVISLYDMICKLQNNP